MIEIPTAVGGAPNAKPPKEIVGPLTVNVQDVPIGPDHGPPHGGKADAGVTGSATSAKAPAINSMRTTSENRLDFMPNLPLPPSAAPMIQTFRRRGLNTSPKTCLSSPDGG